MHDPNDLICLFNHCFEITHNTKLVKGEDEPFYLPAGGDFSYHSILFAHGFFSSALHECAHWFIAGEKRRELEDYGYWYIPDGRNAQQQQIFQTVEVKPQAIEYLLSKAAKYPFHFSLDNLSGTQNDVVDFKDAVFRQAKEYELTGLPSRARLFHQTLLDFYSELELLN
jgi:elongation factor P hydroxylase